MSLKYIFKKIIFGIMTLLITVFLVFAAFAIIPGDPALNKLGNNATPESVAALRESMGLNKPFMERFSDYIISGIKGDFGVSYSYNIPVSELVSEKIPITLFLSVISFVLTIIIGIILGVTSAKYDGRAVDKTIGISNQIVMAIPSFFLGILISYVFGLILKWFVPGGYVSYNVNFGAFLGYLIYPAVAIAIPKIAMVSRLLKSSIMTESRKDYVRTAYSRGNNTSSVLYRHVLKNAIIPVVTFLGMVLTDMIAGSIVIEQVFNIPGLGKLLLTSIHNRDYPVVQFIILFIALLVLVVNFITDMAYHVIDPRVRVHE